MKNLTRRRFLKTLLAVGAGALIQREQIPDSSLVNDREQYSLPASFPSGSMSMPGIDLGNGHFRWDKEAADAWAFKCYHRFSRKDITPYEYYKNMWKL